MKLIVNPAVPIKTNQRNIFSNIVNCEENSWKILSLTIQPSYIYYQQFNTVGNKKSLKKHNLNTNIWKNSRETQK